MKEQDPYIALNWWRTATTPQKEKVIKQWKAQPDVDYRKSWTLKRIAISDTTMIELYNKYVK